MALNPKDPIFQKIFLGALMLGGLLYMFFFTNVVPFTYKANASTVGDLEERYREISKDLNKARQSAHRLPYLEKEYELLNRKWEQSRSLLPEEEDMAWLLRTISLLGAQAGVEFTLFQPLPSKPAEYHTENPIEITVLGGYHQVGTFLSEAANLERIITISNLEITENKKDRGDQPVEASFVAVAYTLGGTATGAAPTSAPAPAAKPGQAARSGTGRPVQRGGAGHE